MGSGSMTVQRKWADESPENRFWILAHWIHLPEQHFKDSYAFEEQVICCMLVDEELRKQATCKPEHFADERLARLFERMVRYPDIDLANLFHDRGKGEILRVIEMFDDVRGNPKYFLYWFDWYCRRVQELGDTRNKFSDSLNFILDNYCFS